jgi:hypothetical protein
MSRDQRRARAVYLLDRLQNTGWFSDVALAEALVVPTDILEAYRSGLIPMPLDRQLCLALFVIEKVPALARLGYQLRGQVQAAVAFETGATTTHSTPPPSVRLR